MEAEIGIVDGVSVALHCPKCVGLTAISGLLSDSLWGRHLPRSPEMQVKIFLLFDCYLPVGTFHSQIFSTAMLLESAIV